MWDLLLNNDEEMIANAARAYLSSELPIERLRPNAPSVDLQKVRASICELGWIGVGLPESVGGSGLGLVEETLIQRECGYYLASPSILATVLGAHVAHHAGKADLAADMIAGKTAAALAIPTCPELRDSPCPVYACDWNGSDPLLVWNDDGMGLIDADAFLEAEPDECLDDSVTLHEGKLSIDRAQCWVGAEQQPLGLRAQVLLAARLVGLAGHACDLSIEYAKVREQFGKPIGSFQAVKHRCADMGVRVRLSWYQTSLASLKVQTGAADAPLQVAAAKLVAAQAAYENGRAGIQIHGGIGFQSECDAHWFLKRAFIYDHAGGAVNVQAHRVIAEPSPLW
jgi:alkylation response protein AidB-like acyl-CoA dehydrogenase